MDRCAIFHLKLLQSKDVNASGSIHKTDQRRCSLLSSSEGNVHLLELVKSSQDTSSGDSSQDVGSSSLHQGHESLVPENLGEAIQRSLVLDSTSGGHHHTPSDGVDGVGHQTSGNCDSPTQEEGQSHSSISAEKHGLECVVESEVHSTVDEDTHGRDGESSVETLDSVRLQSLDVDVNESIELPLTSLALGVIG